MNRVSRFLTYRHSLDSNLDSTGLYYYNAKYYDATIGRFISPDNVGQSLNNPQFLNRYSYCQNNPLNRTDPTGHSSRAWLNMMYAGYTTGVISQELLPWASFLGNGLNIGTALHEIVQVVAAQAISEQFGPAILESLMGNTRKRADIVAGDQVWEVKPLGGEDPESQLRDYTALSGLDRGNNTDLSLNPIDISLVGSIRMNVTFGDPGEIYYEVYRYGKDGQRVDVPDWEVWLQFEWRKDLFELGAAAAIVAIVLAPEITIPSLIPGGAGALQLLPTVGAGTLQLQTLPNNPNISHVFEFN